MIATTYRIDTAGESPADDGPVSGHMDVDVVGSGSTGPSTAIRLAKEHGIKATMIEASTATRRCSTRSGGQAQISSGRLKCSKWIERREVGTPFGRWGRRFTHACYCQKDKEL